MIVRSGTENRLEVHRRVRAGELRRIARGIYTANLDDPIEEVVRRHLWDAVAAVEPGAVVSYRSALTLQPSEEGTVEVEGMDRIVELPGVVIRGAGGPSALQGDTPLPGGIYRASDARLALRNLATSRTSKHGRRTISEEALEEWLDGRIRAMGEDYPRRLIEEAEALALPLGATEELEKLRALVGRVAGTRDERALSPSGRARAAGEPLDMERVTQFQWLASELRKSPVALEQVDLADPVSFRNAAFLDAYFSNYIEGTEFEVEEAEGIVFGGDRPVTRPQDSHDLLASYEILSSRREMLLVGAADQADYRDFEETLRERHTTLMRGRPEMLPGEFKELGNRVGGYSFVDPGEVRGTLRAGYEILRSLSAPLDRALFTAFFIAEVHPFTDGNGRMSRLTMSARLLSSGGQRSLVPTSLRTDYLLALRALSNRHSVEPMRSVIARGQAILKELPLRDLRASIEKLREMRAFDERPYDGSLSAGNARRAGRGSSSPFPPGGRAP